MTEQGEPQHEERHTGEKLWDATLKTFHQATFRANQYKRVVQKKIDLNAVHKKISTLHGELGKLIDDGRSNEQPHLLELPAVQELFHQLDGLKQAAATLEEEIEAIRAEDPPQETEQEPPGSGTPGA